MQSSCLMRIGPVVLIMMRLQAISSDVRTSSSETRPRLRPRVAWRVIQCVAYQLRMTGERFFLCMRPPGPSEGCASSRKISHAAFTALRRRKVSGAFFFFSPSCHSQLLCNTLYRFDSCLCNMDKAQGVRARVIQHGCTATRRVMADPVLTPVVRRASHLSRTLQTRMQTAVMQYTVSAERNGSMSKHASGRCGSRREACRAARPAASSSP
jgi:hypothetical protein